MILRKITCLFLAGAMLMEPAHAFGGGGLLSSLFRSQSQTQVSGFHFDYQIYGGDTIGLLQAFDDERQTFFQFSNLDLKRVPSIWVEDSSGARRALRIEATSPYLVVSEVGRKFVLTVAATKDGKDKSVKEASVVRIGPINTANQSTGSSEPSASGGAKTSINDAKPNRGSDHKETGAGKPADAAAPAKSITCIPWYASAGGKTINVPFSADAVEPTAQAREDIKAVARKISSSGLVHIKGRPSPSGGIAQAQKRADSIKAALVNAGVPESRITVSTEGSAKAASISGVYYAEIIYGKPSSGFMLVDGC